MGTNPLNKMHRLDKRIDKLDLQKDELVEALFANRQEREAAARKISIIEKRIRRKKAEREKRPLMHSLEKMYRDAR